MLTIPGSVLQAHILVCLDNKGLISLSQTCKFFQQLTQEERNRRKLQQPIIDAASDLLSWLFESTIVNDLFFSHPKFKNHNLLERTKYWNHKGNFEYKDLILDIFPSLLKKCKDQFEVFSKTIQPTLTENYAEFLIDILIVLMRQKNIDINKQGIFGFTIGHILFMTKDQVAILNSIAGRD